MEEVSPAHAIAQPLRPASETEHRSPPVVARLPKREAPAVRIKAMAERLPPPATSRHRRQRTASPNDMSSPRQLRRPHFSIAEVSLDDCRAAYDPKRVSMPVRWKDKADLAG